MENPFVKKHNSLFLPIWPEITTARTRTRTRTHAHAHTHTHTHTRTRAHTHTRTRTRTHTHARTHAHTHTHTHTHTPYKNSFALMLTVMNTAVYSAVFIFHTHLYLRLFLEPDADLHKQKHHSHYNDGIMTGTAITQHSIKWYTHIVLRLWACFKKQLQSNLNVPRLIFSWEKVHLLYIRARCRFGDGPGNYKTLLLWIVTASMVAFWSKPRGWDVCCHLFILPFLTPLFSIFKFTPKNRET